MAAVSLPYPRENQLPPSSGVPILENFWGIILEKLKVLSSETGILKAWKTKSPGEGMVILAPSWLV
jgi:hypothetical protein